MAESVKPSFNVEFERKVALANINGEYFHDVSVYVKAYDGVWRECVKVVVKSQKDYVIYSKRFKTSRL